MKPCMPRTKITPTPPNSGPGKFDLPIQNTTP